MNWIKKIGNNLAWLIIGFILAMAGVVYANVTVPNATTKGDLPTGLATGNYQLFHPGADGTCFIASSTSPFGWVSGSCSTGAGNLPTGGTTDQFLGNTATNVPAWLTATSTSSIFIDGNNGLNNQNGSNLFPYHTLSQAVASSTGVGPFGYTLDPGTYVDGAPITYPSVPFFMQGNESTYVVPSGVTFPGSFDIYDITIVGNVLETDNSLNFIHQFANSVLTNNLSLAGNATLSGVAMTGTTSALTIQPGALTNAINSIFYSQIQDYGIFNLDDDQVQASSSQYAIIATTTGSQLNINGATIIQTGNGGAININNGATSTPNNISNLSIVSNTTTAIGILNAGNSATFLCSYHANNLVGTPLYASGTNFIPCANGALLVQATTTLQGALSLNGIIGIPGKFLGNTSTGTPGWLTPGYATVCASGCDFTATGTNDSVGINAAIASVSTNGGTVLIKAGTYNIATNSQLTLLSNVNLLGEGYGTQINVSTGTTIGLLGNGISNSSISNIRFNDPTPDAAFGITQYTLLQLSNSHNITIQNNWVTNSSGFDIFVKSTNANTSSNISILNNYLYANGHQDVIGGGPSVQGNSTTSDITITGNTITQTTGSGLTLNSNLDANCIDIVAVYGMKISNNTCYGRILYGTEKFPNSFSQISHNTIYPALGLTLVSGQISVYGNDAATSTSQGLQITNNTLTNGTINISGNSVTSLKNLLVEGNTIYNSPSTYQNDDNNGIRLVYVTSGHIDNNNVYGAGDNTKTGILIASSTNTTVGTNLIDTFTKAVDVNSGSGNKVLFNDYQNISGQIINNATSTANLDSFGNLAIDNSKFLWDNQNNILAVLSNNINNYATWSLGRTVAEGRFAIPASAGQWINDAAAGDLAIRNESTAKKILLGLGTGNSTIAIANNLVGINTTNPSAALEVRGVTGTSTPIFVVATSTGTSYVSVSSVGKTSLNSLLLQNVASGTQCLQADGSGNVTGTGSACGGGGGSLSGGTTGYVATWASSTALTIGTLIDNGTVAGVNATSSTASFNIKGVPSLNPFVIASSTGTTMFRVNNLGNVLINSFSNTGYPLEVDGGNISDVNVFIQNNATSGTSGFKLADNTGFPKGTIGYANASSSLGAGNVYIGSYGSGGASVMLGNSSFGSASPKLTVNGTTGFTGINTTIPGSQLDVNGTTNLGGTLNVVSTSTLAYLTGSTQCLFVDTSGNIQGTGSACGSSSGVASGTAGNIQFSNGSGGFNANGLFNWINTGFPHLAIGGMNLGGLSNQMAATDGTGIFLTGNISTGTGFNVVLKDSTSGNPTTGNNINGIVEVNNNFNAASGNSTYTGLQIDNQTNQTGSATGITRGLYIIPTILSAFDYRGFEVAGFSDKLSTSTSITNANGSIFNFPTYTSASGSLYTLNTAATLNVTGAPNGTVSSTTIASSTGITVGSNALTNVTNGYGLYVNAPTGATNNYAASFNGTTTISNALGIGTMTFGAPFVPGQTVLAMQRSFPGYIESNIQNQSNSTTASSYYTLTADNGNSSAYYTHLFQNSSAFTNTGGVSGGAGDSGLFNSDNSLYVGTASTTNINANLYLAAQNTIIATGTQAGFTFSNATTTNFRSLGVATLNTINGNTLNVSNLIGFASNCLKSDISGNVTGTSVPCIGGAGGGLPGQNAYWTSANNLGASGDMFDNGTVAGVNATSSTVAFNVQGTGAIDPLRVGTSTMTNMLFVKGSNGRVGIGTNTPLSRLAVGNALTMYDVTPTGASSFTSSGYLFNASMPEGLVSETAAANGDILTLGINTTQVGTRNTAVEGGVFRLDTRSTGGFAAGQQSFYLLGFPTGSSTGYTRMIVSLQDGTTALAPSGGNVGIGTTTIAAKLTVQGDKGSSNPFQVTSSTGTTLFNISPAGEILLGGGNPTMGTCGTSPSISGNDNTGTVTVGSGVVTSCAVLFGTSKKGIPHVFITVDGVTAIANSVSSVSTAGFTANFAATLGSGTFDYLIISN
jgi:hypothetical protein